MKLASIAHLVLLKASTKMILESIEGTASDVKSKLFALGTELKKDGEDITDDEVQAAMLSALIDADGKVANVDVSDVDSIKKEIKESRTYINESGVLHSIEAVGTVLGNSAFLHTLAEGLQKLGFNSVDEKSMKAKIEKIVSGIKKVTGFPAKVMEKSFAWIADKLGFSKFGQTIAGISGTILATLLLLALAAYLFPSISSGVLIVFAITGMVGKSFEIKKLVEELVQYIREQGDLKTKPAPTIQ